MLVDRERLSRQGGFVDLEVYRVDQARVCGNKVPRFHQNDIPDHQFGRGNDVRLPVPDDLAGGRRHLLQRVERLFRLALLHDPKDRVQHHDDEDDETVHPFARVDNEGYHRRDEENDDQNVCKLF